MARDRYICGKQRSAGIALAEERLKARIERNGNSTLQRLLLLDAQIIYSVYKRIFGHQMGQRRMARQIIVTAGLCKCPYFHSWPTETKVVLALTQRVDIAVYPPRLTRRLVSILCCGSGRLAKRPRELPILMHCGRHRIFLYEAVAVNFQAWIAGI